MCIFRSWFPVRCIPTHPPTSSRPLIMSATTNTVRTGARGQWQPRGPNHQLLPPPPYSCCLSLDCGAFLRQELQYNDAQGTLN